MADRKVADTANVLHLLWQHFDVNKASDEDLDFLSNASEEASSLARCAADAAGSAAAQICDDKEAGRNLTSVNGVSIEDYLFQVAHTFSVIAELSEVGSAASYFVSERLKTKLNAKSRRVVIAEQSSSKTVEVPK